MLGCSHGQGPVPATLRPGLSWQCLPWTSHLLIQGVGERSREMSRSQQCGGGEKYSPAPRGGPSFLVVELREGREKEVTLPTSATNTAPTGGPLHTPHQNRGHACCHLPGAFWEALYPALSVHNSRVESGGERHMACCALASTWPRTAGARRRVASSVRPGRLQTLEAARLAPPAVPCTSAPTRSPAHICTHHTQTHTHIQASIVLPRSSSCSPVAPSA